MQIHTLTFNDDNGIRTLVFNNQASLDIEATKWVLDNWDDKIPCPDDWRDACEKMYDWPGFIDSIHHEIHEVKPPIQINPI